MPGRALKGASRAGILQGLLGPAGHFAGGLIEQCGLKGTTVGGAQVSEKHAGFVINTGQATCQDILTLIRLVRDRVFQQTGVRLEPEVRLLGCTLEEP